jgi:fibronectin type 3 domain-containing protein
MKKSLHPFPAVRVFFLFSLLTLSLLAGCQKVRGLFAHADAQNPHSVTIGWTAAKPPVEGYNVYRIVQFSGPIRLTTRIVTDTQFIDRNVQAGSTYTYYVTSVDSRGMESKPSEKISVTVPK